MFQRVFVLDKNKKPLTPCNPARARILLSQGKASVFRMVPFSIILKYEVKDETSKVKIKVDPGSKYTGITLLLYRNGKYEVIYAIEIQHKSLEIKLGLEKRKGVRKSRRFRKTRYRKARFNNRKKKEGWLPPSLESIINNIITWINRFNRWSNLDSISLENIKFDTQKLQNPEISGAEYQQGELFGYEIRNYLLTKWNHTCAYCGAKDVPLEIDHIHPKSKGGSNRVSNLTIACHKCNQAKSNKNIEDFLKNKHDVLKKVLSECKKSLSDAAKVNSIRNKLYRELEKFNLPIELGSGGMTKFNRINQGYPKDHWIDSACVGESGRDVRLDPNMKVLIVKAMGRGNRQMCRVDKYGFPRSKPKTSRPIHGFRTGDLVLANVPKGKNKGCYTGYVSVRTSGSFKVNSIDGINWKYCRKLQCSDGYRYSIKNNKNV